MPPFVDLWGWFNSVHVQAQRENNADLLRLVGLFGGVQTYLELDPQRALADCNEAVELAKQLRLPCLALFYGYWRCEAYVFYLCQYDLGLRESVSLAMEARKPEYAQCPVRGRVFRVLVDAYEHVDFFGYASEITAMLDYMEKDVPLDQDTWLLIAETRALLADIEEDYEKALELVEVYLARCQHSTFRLTDAYTKLCWLNYKLKHFEVIKGLAEEGEKCARGHNRRLRSVSVLLAWKAFALHREGQKAEARRAAVEAVRQANALGARSLYHSPLCYYYEARGDLAKAVELRREQLGMEMTSGGNAGEASVRLEICKLLAKMNLPLAEELALARQATGKLRRPEKIRDKLDRLENGEILD